MTFLLIITIAPSPIRSQIPHTLFNMTSLGVDAVLCHDQNTCKTVHTCARSKMTQHNIVNNVQLFSYDWFQGNSTCIDRRQSTQLCPEHMGRNDYEFYYDTTCLIDTNQFTLSSPCDKTRTRN